MGATGHLSVRQGTRVKVFLRQGMSYVAKFKERKAKTVDFYDHAPEPTKNIRTLTIHKAK